MSLQWKVPHQSRFIQTANVFAATFNVPTLGQYDWAVALNAGVVVLPLQANTEYLIERVTIGADISEADYAAALNLTAIATIPALSLRRSRDNMTVYESSIPILRFIEQQEAATWLHSDNSDDSLTATITGSLFQTAALVGLASIRLSVSFAIYAIESTVYNRAFRGSQSLALADGVRGG